MTRLETWPDLPYESWKDSCATLHLWTQVVGKLRLVTTPWVNHSWQVALYLTARGLTTSPMPYGNRLFQVDFDFVDHQLQLMTAGGEQRIIKLEAMPVADFYHAVIEGLSGLGVELSIDTLPNEIPDGIPFERDREHASYDPEAVNRFWQVLLQVDRVFKDFRTGFLGKVSPVHFFWGSFDLAVTRFSGRKAPPHPGGVPRLSDAVTREAYSHEVSSAGFWPGGGGLDHPAFYSYAYPVPEGFGAQPIEPEGAVFSQDLGEFLLPYDVVREAADPDATLLRFLESSYAAAAVTAKWDRSSLERPRGLVGQPPEVAA